jgi:choline dehydrogenase
VSSRRRFLHESALLLGIAALTPAAARRQDVDRFDVIVVGAGAAGCLLANRLSADPHTRVLLVEAGGPDAHPLIPVPGKWTTLLGTELDWNYETEPEPALNGRAIRWPRGRTLGGSTAINAMAYVRGHRSCFDAWAQEAGAAWSYQAALPYFRRLEDNSRGASDYLGARGPLAVSDTTDPHAGHAAFLEAASELGFGARPDWDFNGARQENGAGFYQKNIRKGRRHSAADAFLRPVASRPNLAVWSNTRALRLMLDGRRAVALEAAREGRTVRAQASREIVLAAGVIGTPKLLMLSGIGPADELRRLGIPAHADVPGVGRNLQDHPRVSMRWAARKPLPGSSVSAGLFTYSRRGSGARPPDIQFYVGRGLDTVEPFVTLTVAMTQPQSRGRVVIQSADPTTAPDIHANYYGESADLDAMVDAVRLAQSLAGTRAYDGLRGSPADPAPAGRSDRELRAFVRAVSDTIFHPVGTCRMGTTGDSVVDPSLRVRGVDGLRVADASVMPTVVNSQTLAATLLIAERAAELIRA